MNPVTLKDIADKLNLSKSTVSRALKDHPDISPATKKQIVDMAKKLEYQPNFIAQSMTTRQTKTIGIIVPEIWHEFFGSVVSGAEEVANKRGYNIMVCQSSEKYEREYKNTNALISKQVDGLLVSVSQETKDSSHFNLAQKRGIPLVFFNRVCEGVEAASVQVDDKNGAYEAVKHLINKGYKRIAHFSGPQAISVCQERMAGYKKAMEEFGLPLDKDYILSGGFSEEDGVFHINKILKMGKPLPDAIFTINDPVAIGAIICLKENGYKIPQDIALAGFSDDRVSSYIEPNLTTVRQPTKELGRVAMELLLKQIESQKLYPDEKIILKTELIIRNSS